MNTMFIWCRLIIKRPTSICKFFRWKEECQTITQKFEMKVTDLRAELSREKKRVGELTKLLRDSKNKTADVSSLV